MIRSDHQSPIASKDRATGQSALSRLVRFTIANPHRAVRATFLTQSVSPRNGSEPRIPAYIYVTAPRTRRVLPTITALCGCVIKPDALREQPSLIMQPNKSKGAGHEAGEQDGVDHGRQ